MPPKQALEFVKNINPDKTVIVCIGNRLKGDDAAGCIVSDLLKDRIKSEVIDAGTTPENFIGPVIKKTPQNIIIIDAVDFAAQPGTFKIFSPQEDQSFSISTHSVSLTLFCDCITSEIPCQFFLIGIQPGQTDFNCPLSKEVKDAVEKISDKLVKILS
ncbi:MAG: hydrogenase 3 maturation endopeptidase HyCI [Sedimentisphaerales bacterium]|nr:hydrogenase 3 maturation endopeptidase HyCI [Sedimentisphaerales bacterium]